MALRYRKLIYPSRRKSRAVHTVQPLALNMAGLSTSFN